MSYTEYIKENNITKSLSEEEIWIAAQRQLVVDYIASLTPICLTNGEIDKIIEKINERA